MPRCRKNSNCSTGGFTTTSRASGAALRLRWIARQRRSCTAAFRPMSQHACCERSPNPVRRGTSRCFLNFRWSKGAAGRALHRVTDAPRIRRRHRSALPNSHEGGQSRLHGRRAVRRLNSSSNSFADERGLDFAMERRDVTVAKPCEQACCPPACRSGRRHGDFLRSGVDVKTRSPGLSPKPLL